MISTELILLLIVIAIFSGIGISALGPGGIFLTIALYLFVPISSAQVAGTASLTFIATGILAAFLFHQTGDYGTGLARELTYFLSFSGLFGAFLGSQVNFTISDRIFGYLLAIFVISIGLMIIYQESTGLERKIHLRRFPRRVRQLILIVIGMSIGFISGLLGVGGPVLAVPVLVILGTPMLISLAVSQIQSIFISGFATMGYWIGDGVVVTLAILVGLPQLIGVIIGWKIAHKIDERWLRLTLGIVLIIIAPIIAI